MKILQLVKKLGLYPIYIIGGLFCIGLITGGAVAISKKNWIQQTINDLSNTIDDINSSLKMVDTTITDFKSYFDTSVSDLAILLSQLEDVNQKLGLVSSSYDTSKIQSQLQDIIDAIQSFENIAYSTQETIDSVYDTLDDLFNPEFGQITTALDSIEIWLTNANQNGSTEWHYYDLISKLLLSIGSILMGITLIGLILLFVFYKRVDGVYVSKSKLKKHLTTHIQKLVQKYPELKRHLKETYGIS